MNKFTIQQLQQMRESEDRVEFKAGEGGNVSYDGRGKTNPKDRRRSILGYVIAPQRSNSTLSNSLLSIEFQEAKASATLTATHSKSCCHKDS